MERTGSKKYKRRNWIAWFTSIMQLTTRTMLISFITTIKIKFKIQAGYWAGLEENWAANLGYYQTRAIPDYPGFSFSIHPVRGAMGISLACDVTDETSFNNKYSLYFLTYSLIGSILGCLMQLSKARKLKLIKFSNFLVDKLLHRMSFLLALKS